MILLAAYIDDILSADPSFKRCVKNLKSIISLLTSLGFYINVDKSIFVPSQIMEFLGFIINTVEMTIELTQSKRQIIASLCQEILSSQDLTIRKVAKLLEKMSSVMISIRYSKMHYRNLERFKGEALK